MHVNGMCVAFVLKITLTQQIRILVEGLGMYSVNLKNCQSWENFKQCKITQDPSTSGFRVTLG